MKKSEDDQWGLKAMTQVLIGGGIAVAVSFLVLFVCAIAISKGWISQDKSGWCSVAAAVISSFVGGIIAVSRCKGRSLIVGLLTGLVLFLILLTAGFLIYQSVALEEGGLPLGCGCLLGGALAGLFGARPKKKRRK